MTRRLLAWVPAAVWMAAIFLASGTTDIPDLPGGISDKLAHAAAYALLGALVLVGIAGGRVRAMTRGAAVGALLLASAYGMTDELHQLYVAGRSASAADWFADTAGAAAGAFLLQAIAARLGRSPRNRDV